MRWARALRRAAAPWLIERPDVAYGVAAVVLLLLIAWGPLPALRMVIPVLLLIALAALGVAALRRQVAAEFPEATVLGAHASWQARVAHARASLRERIGRRHEQPARSAERAGTRPGGDGTAPALAPPPAAAPTTVGPAERVALLERLATLHERGVLNDEELAAEKAALTHAGDGA